MWSISTRVQRENTLHALAEADLADRDGFAHAGVIARDHDAFKSLKALFVAFLDLDVDADGVAAAEHRSIRAEILIDVLA